MRPSICDPESGQLYILGTMPHHTSVSTAQLTAVLLSSNMHGFNKSASPPKQVQDMTSVDFNHLPCSHRLYHMKEIALGLMVAALRASESGGLFRQTSRARSSTMSDGEAIASEELKEASNHCGRRSRGSR